MRIVGWLNGLPTAVTGGAAAALVLGLVVVAYMTYPKPPVLTDTHPGWAQAACFQPKCHIVAKITHAVPKPENTRACSGCHGTNGVAWPK